MSWSAGGDGYASGYDRRGNRCWFGGNISRVSIDDCDVMRNRP